MILTWLTKYSDFGLLLLRLVVGGMFIFVHGWPKIAGGAARWKEIGGAIKHVGVSFFSPEIWGFLAAVSEFGGGILFLLGLLFRPACAMLFGVMAVATAMHFKVDGTFMAASHAIELGVVFLALIFVGPGRFSFDKS